MEISLEKIGLSEEALAERVVNKLVDDILVSLDYDEETQEWNGSSTFLTRLDKMVKDRLNQVIENIGQNHVLPKVTEMVETLVLQETNTWGEKVGKPLTFIEYMVSRAEAYMREPVNFNGKTKAEDSYSWKSNTTRISYMIDKHLQYSIESAMKQALKDANASITKGLEEAVKISLREATNKLSVKVST